MRSLPAAISRRNRATSLPIFIANATEKAPMGDLCASGEAAVTGAAAAATLRAIPEGNADTAAVAAAQPLLKGPLSGKVPIPPPRPCKPNDKPRMALCGINEDLTRSRSVKKTNFWGIDGGAHSARSWNNYKDRSVPFAPSSGRDQIIVLGRLEDGGGLRVRAARRRDAWEGTLCRVANASFSEFM